MTQTLDVQLQLDHVYNATVTINLNVVAQAEAGTVLLVSLDSSPSHEPEDLNFPTNEESFFFFAMNDVDGLPLARQYYEGINRLEEFRAELHRVGHESDKSKLLQLSWDNVTGSGNLVRARVLLEYPGEHFVLLRGPSGVRKYELVPWRVRVFGSCSTLRERAEDGKCECTMGAYQLELDGVATCIPCAHGEAKPQVGPQQCQSCVALSSGFTSAGNADVHRRETREPDGDRNPLDHNGLSKCGCAARYFLEYGEPATSPRRLTETCPQGSSQVLWSKLKQDGLHSERVANYTAECEYLHLDLTAQEKWFCIAQECRRQYLQVTLPPIQENHNSIADCNLCDPDSTICDQTFLTLSNVIIRPGFWRSNEFSRDLRPCRPALACKGADVGRSIDDLCQPGHWGPYCGACLFEEAPMEAAC